MSVPFGVTLDEELIATQNAAANAVDTFKNEIVSRRYRQVMLLEGAKTEARKAHIAQQFLDALCGGVTSQHQRMAGIAEDIVSSMKEA
ncbi:MAG: hypothetical protein ACE5HE_08840 [Phycisphaerae bacterium]